MGPPIPAPRTQPTDAKKPVPTPRNKAAAMAATASKPKEVKDEHTNTFSKRVRSLSNASKQIAEDIGELVLDKKKAVIEGTRQSVRRLTKRLNSHPPTNPEPETEEDGFDDNIDIFSSISFESPINQTASIYSNVDEELVIPPPQHPPPPLRPDVLYDAPSTIGSTSNSDQSVPDPQLYDSVFPTESNLSRSGSWRFYDPVPRQENVYTEVEIRNSIYENHVIEDRDKPVVRESVILQFDPLSDRMSSEDIRVLEDFFQGDLYGNAPGIAPQDEWSLSNESETEEYIAPPPPPPVRFDSLPDDDEQAPPPYQSPKQKTKSQWFTEPVKDTTPTPVAETKKHKWLKQIRGALEKAPGGGRNRDAVVQRPELEVKSFVQKKGMLYKVQSGPVEDLFGEYSGRWCILQNTNFLCYADSECNSIKEHFPSESILSLQILQDPKFKYKYDNDDLHCFELNTTGKSRGGHVYGAKDISERRVWMQSICESLTKRFPAKITTDYTRMGWAYVREGVGGKWVGAWILLGQRTLHYAIDNEPNKSIDLRQARCIVLQVYRDVDNNPRTNDKGPNIVLDSPTKTLYLRMWTSRETKVWCHIIKLAAHNNGAYLDQQQLTKNEIPVLVEKCINFIYTHGSMSEGIYRRSGTNTAAADILLKFRKDAWAVQLTIDKYSEHDVATALKRFIRDLPEPILSSSQHRYLHQVSLVKHPEEKIRMYRACLEQLPPVSYKTAKKLLGHLNFIASQKSKNLMGFENLSAVWGPSLMHQDDKEGVSGVRHMQNSVVVRQLLELYKDIFPEDPSEVEKEKLMLQVLERHNKAPQSVQNRTKSSGDFRLWIYLHSKEGQSVNVAIGPNKTAYEVCKELSPKIDIPVHELILEEVVLNDHLQRPVHASEKVLDIILGWSYWDEADRKDNCLILIPVSKYADLVPDKLVPISGELKFSDTRSKNFKPLMLELSQANLNCYKDKTCEEKLFSYRIEEIVWYLGNEPKRNPQSRWTLTFIEAKSRPKRSKATPYFGNVLAWSEPQTRGQWVGMMIRSRYRDSIVQPAVHVDLMER